MCWWCCRLVDTLAKHWGGSGSAALPAQLEKKMNSHNLLLQCLSDSGCLARLPPATLRYTLTTVNTDTIHIVSSGAGYLFDKPPCLLVEPRASSTVDPCIDHHGYILVKRNPAMRAT